MRNFFMKIRNTLLFAVIYALGTNLFVTNVFATDLMDVYKQALTSDPKFKAAQAQWLADRENLAISRADLFPQIGAEGVLARNRNTINTNSGSGTYFNKTTSYSLKLVQPIFNFSTWAKIWASQAIAKKAQAAFLAAEENLLLRTAQAYFNVLLAKDVLSYSKANKDSFGRLLSQVKHKFDVGLVAITDLEETKAKYDKAVADEIKAVNDLSDRFEQLNEITGIRYHDLDTIVSDLPLISPQPDNIEQWVKAAEKQNYDLAAANFDTITARENIKIQNAGHLPTISAQGSYSSGYDNNVQGSETFNRSKTASATLGVSVPIFQGGKVVASARQADYQYQQKLAVQNQTHRAVISQTRQAYLGILSSISKIRADLQAIKSSESALRAVQAGYTAGTRTMTDVLTSQTQLYETQKNFAQDEYNYINQTLTLKALTGILEGNDLKQVNSWLKKPTTIKRIKTADKKADKKIEPQSKQNKKSIAMAPIVTKSAADTLADATKTESTKEQEQSAAVTSSSITSSAAKVDQANKAAVVVFSAEKTASANGDNNKVSNENAENRATASNGAVNNQ